MIKKLTLLLIAVLFLTKYSIAQNVRSGINTKDPQQTLHIAGSSTSTAIGTTGSNLVTPTMRINGLNATNNTAHLAADGTNSLKRVYASNDGDLVIIDNTLEQPVLAQEFGDVIATNELIGTGSGLLSTSLKSQSFTLLQPSVVYFSATFGALLRETSGGVPVVITDGEAKLYGSFFRLTAVPASSGLSTTATFGDLRMTYSNQSSGSNGVFVLSPRATLVLPAGSYTVELFGAIAYDGIGNPFRVQFGGTTSENFLIHAIPTKYQ